jgi:hypothetical protein
MAWSLELAASTVPMPLLPHDGHLRQLRGSRGTTTFTWPLEEWPLGVGVVRSLLPLHDLVEESQMVRCRCRLQPAGGAGARQGAPADNPRDALRHRETSVSRLL